MEVFDRALMDTYCADGIYFDHPCKVRIDEEMLVIEYLNESEQCAYRGHSSGQGHYRLQGVHTKADATLHRFADAKILEGFWAENGEQGMWRIRLSDD